MFSISMGGCDIILGVEWLHTLGSITMYYQESCMVFAQYAHTYTLEGIQVGTPKIISSHWMKKLLKKGHHGVIAQLNSI
jgi:hypothetical protein